MVDVSSALLSVQERDNWRRRMDVLERSLREVRGERRKVETRLRRVRRELARLRAISEAAFDSAQSSQPVGMNAAPSPALRSR